MRRLGNTLYVTSHGSRLFAEGEAVVVRLEGKVRARIPMHNLEGIVTFGTPSISSELACRCAERRIALSLLSYSGRFRARISGATTGNVLLRRAQYRVADDINKAADISRSIVIGKIVNQRTILRRAQREKKPSDSGSKGLAEAAERLGALLDKLRSLVSTNVIRGIEGEAARTYFGAFNDMLRVNDNEFKFTGRSRRPPRDRINALLSFLYTLLRLDMQSALETEGLDPAVGFLHVDRPGRPSLALDILEELRAPMADRLALTLVNRRQLTPQSFDVRESGAVRLTPKARSVVLTAVQDRKRREIQHPILGEEVAIGLIPHVQSRLLARHLRGDLDAYPPMVWR